MKKIIILLLAGIILISSCTSVIIKDINNEETGFVIDRIKDIGGDNYVQYDIAIVNGEKRNGKEISFTGKIGLSIGDTLVFRKKNNFYPSFWHSFRVTYIEKGDKGYHYHMTREVFPPLSYNQIQFTSEIRYKIGDTLALQKR